MPDRVNKVGEDTASCFYLTEIAYEETKVEQSIIVMDADNARVSGRFLHTSFLKGSIIIFSTHHSIPGQKPSLTTPARSSQPRCVAGPTWVYFLHQRSPERLPRRTLSLGLSSQPQTQLCHL